MPAQLSGQVRFEPLTGDGASYRLPGPQLGPGRWSGLLSVPVGLMISVFGLCLILGAAGFGPGGGAQDNGWRALPLLLFGLVSLFIGIRPVIGGLYLAFGHERVELREDQLRAVRCLGPLRWTKRRDTAAVQRLAVRPPQPAHRLYRHRRGMRDPIADADLAVLTAEGRSMPPLTLAIGYPHRWLIDLAHDLTDRFSGHRPAVVVDDRWASDVSGSATHEPTPNESDIAATADETAAEAVAEPPPGSDIAIDRHADGITFTVPPSGARKGSKGMLSFSLFSLAVIGGITAGFIALVLKEGASDGNSPWGIALGLIPFWAVALGLLIAAINMGRRRIIIDVTGDALLITRRDLFATKQHKWSAQDLHTIEPGPSGMADGNRPLMQLHIQPRRGRRIGLMTERDVKELHWLASQLRHALGLPDPADRPRQP